MPLAALTAALLSLAPGPRLALELGAPPPPSPETELQEALKARERQLEEELRALVAKAERVEQPRFPLVITSVVATAFMFFGAELLFVAFLAELFFPSTIEFLILSASGAGGILVGLGLVLVMSEVDSDRLEEKHALQEERKRVEEELRNVRLRMTQREPVTVPIFAVAF